jgi:SAM-dependent methyltransferase
MTNAEQREYWNSDESQHWVKHQEVYDQLLERFGARVIEAASLAPGERVLDVGCGCGATTILAARATAPGPALGVDLSEPMLAVARERARRAGVDSARFRVADAQSYPFEAQTVDVAMSRFGVMFFDDPVAAFANIRGALRPDGRIVFVCWRDLLENEWLSVPGAAVLQYLPLPEAGAPGGPGPFAFADPDRVREILTAAGFTGVEVDRAHEPMLYAGLDADGVVGFMRGTGMGRALFADADPALVDKAIAAARDALTPYATDEGIRTSGTAWLVQARAGSSSGDFAAHLAPNRRMPCP